MEEKNQKLREAASELVTRGEKQDKAQQQLYAELQLESQMSKQRIEDEMHQEIANSAAHGQRERAALQQKQEARVTAMRSRSKLFETYRFFMIFRGK